MLSNRDSLKVESKYISVLKFSLIILSIVLATGTAAATDLNNIETITPSGTNPINITGNLDMNSNNINNFFGSSCSTGNVAAHINDDGTLDCVDATSEVQNDFVARSGDSMTGNLDMNGNKVNNINKIQLNNIETVSDGQIGRDNSIGYLGNWGGNGNAVLWDSYNVQEGNAISISGGKGDESNPQIAVNEGSISHNNIAGVSYNDHHGLGNGLTWDGSNNPAISSGGVDSNEIASGAVSTTELNTGSVDGRYINRGGDSMSGNLNITGTTDVDGSSAPLIVTENGGDSLHLGGNEIDSVNGDLHLQNNNGGTVNVRSDLNMSGNAINNIDWANSDNPNTDNQGLSYSNDNAPTGDYVTHSVNIDNGNNINIRDYYEPDTTIADNQNLQSSRSGDTVTIDIDNGNGASFTDNYEANTDNQNLSNVVGQGNSISSGQTIDASAGAFRLPTGTDAW